MRAFVDTSAFLAVLVATDGLHAAARGAFERLEARDATLVSSSYVLVESYALLGRRHGREAVRAFREGLARLLEVTWVDEELHERALDLLQARDSRGLSLVDAVSFLVIREKRIDAVLAYDRHFKDEGFRLVG